MANKHSPGCKCCVTTPPTCAVCEGNLPPMKVVDSAIGGPFNELAPGDPHYSSGYPAATSRGFLGSDPDGVHFVGYVLRCKGGFTDRFDMSTFRSTNASAIQLATLSTTSSNTILSASISDCTHPGSLAFSVTAPSPPFAPNPWSGGATITFSPQ